MELQSMEQSAKVSAQNNNLNAITDPFLYP